MVLPSVASWIKSFPVYVLKICLRLACCFLHSPFWREISCNTNWMHSDKWVTGKCPWTIDTNLLSTRPVLSSKDFSLLVTIILKTWASMVKINYLKQLSYLANVEKISFLKSTNRWLKNALPKWTKYLTGGPWITSLTWATIGMVKSAW